MDKRKMTRKQELELINQALNTQKHIKIELGKSTFDDPFLNFRQTHSTIAKNNTLKRKIKMKLVRNNK